MEIDNYLEMCLRADLIYFYSKGNNEIQMSIDASNCETFFVNKKTMQIIFFIFFSILNKKSDGNI